LRERAIELVDLDLGPRTEREVETTLRAEVEAERLTSIDRSLLKTANAQREVDAAGRDAFDQTLRAGRLAKLARLGLAEPVDGTRYRLADNLEDTLRHGRAWRYHPDDAARDDHAVLSGPRVIR
jgi:type IV secretory pathway VirD2 relaxase